jgi:hypothetical protein
MLKKGTLVPSHGQEKHGIPVSPFPTLARDGQVASARSWAAALGAEVPIPHPKAHGNRAAIGQSLTARLRPPPGTRSCARILGRKDGEGVRSGRCPRPAGAAASIRIRIGYEEESSRPLPALCRPWQQLPVAVAEPSTHAISWIHSLHLPQTATGSFTAAPSAIGSVPWFPSLNRWPRARLCSVLACRCSLLLREIRRSRQVPPPGAVAGPAGLCRQRSTTPVLILYARYCPRCSAKEHGHCLLKR